MDPVNPCYTLLFSLTNLTNSNCTIFNAITSLHLRHHFANYSAVFEITSYIIFTSLFYMHIITYVMGLRNRQFAQTFANIFVQYAYWQANRRPLYKASVADAEKWTQYISIKRKHFAFNISKVLLLSHLFMYLCIYLLCMNAVDSMLFACVWAFMGGCDEIASSDEVP